MAQVLTTFIAVAGTLLGYQFQRRGYHSTSGNGYSSATAARTRCRVSSGTRSTQPPSTERAASVPTSARAAIS
ncbi:hypothetical protein ACFXPY_17225 [Streptomyces sp. NPDC059153]|uniref:hypothetical protein n=1 Tax=Streptomyces sp. NPDC059153 TaxID=3346743 RepID=UPI0036B44D9C